MADDEDESAFLSAEEGDGEEDDHKPCKIVPVASKSQTQAPAPARPAIPSLQLKTTEKRKQISTKAKRDEEWAPVSKEISKEPAVKSDGWDVDDWDIADDEDVMATPASERPPVEKPEKIVSPLPSSTPETAAVWERDIESPKQPNRQPENVPRQQSHQKPSSLWGGWGQLLSAATDSLSTLTNTVGEGLTNVLETLESTVGAPTPEELARLSTEERAELQKKADDVKEPAPVGEKDDCDSASEAGSDSATTRSDKDDLSSGYQSDSTLFVKQRKDDGGTAHYSEPPGFTSLFSGVSHLLENTGKSIVSSSLDVLETIGRKTFETMTIADPSSDVSAGDEKQQQTQRRRLKIPLPTTNRKDDVTLSQILRELKEQADVDSEKRQKNEEARRCNYAAQFEDAKGFICLEALEMLSTSSREQMRSMTETLSTDKLDVIAETLEHLKCNFETSGTKNSVDDEVIEHDLPVVIRRELKSISPMASAFSPNRLLAVDEEARTWIRKCIEDLEQDEKSYSPKIIYEKCIQTLASLTAASVELYHKVGQLLLVPDAAKRIKSKHLANITSILSDEMLFLSSRFTTAVSTVSTEDSDAVSTMMTNIFFEASNSAGYVREAFKLTLPIVELATVRTLV